MFGHLVTVVKPGLYSKQTIIKITTTNVEIFNQLLN